MVEYALKYAEKYDMAIVPLHFPIEGKCSCHKGSQCISPGKHPIISNGQHGWSKDPEQIKDWWGKWPNANIGVVTGEASNGLAIIDIDSEEGLKNINQYIPYNIKYPISKTARNGFGQHWIFKTHYNIGDKIGNIKGSDLRNNGIIVLPPSLGITGKRYEWKMSLKENPIPELPQSYINVIESQSQRAEGYHVVETYSSPSSPGQP